MAYQADLNFVAGGWARPTPGKVLAKNRIFALRIEITALNRNDTPLLDRDDTLGRLPAE